MSPANTSAPSSSFLLLLGSSSPHRRRGRVSALRSCGGVGLHWTPRRLSRVGTVICATAAGDGGGRGREKSAANAAAGASAKPGDVRSSTVKVVEKKDPVPSVNIDASESTAKAETSAPEQDTSITKRNRALGSSANKSVTSHSSSAVASKENASGNIPVKKSELESKSKVVPLAPASKSETVSNAKAAAPKDTKVGGLSDSKTPSPLPTAQGPPALNDKNKAGVAGRVEAKADTGVVAKEASSDDYDQNKDSAPLAGVNVMNVIVVAAECSPWCKTGGLGDVAGALPKALARRGHRVMVVVPRYGDYAQAKDLGVHRQYKVAGQDSEVSYFHAYIDGVDFVFIDAPPFRHRHGDIYGGERSDVLKRMILFCKAAVEVPWHASCGGVCYGDGNLVFIANDWHTALLPVYLKAYYRDNGLMQFTRSILVIHNIAHQGRGPVDDFFVLDLPEHYIEQFKLYDPVGGDHNNIFAAGLKMADRVVTVSHGYLRELKTSEGGWGLHEIINQNDWKLHGIVNGIDMGDWNPEVDVHLQSDGYTNYSLETVDIGKRKCKTALQRQLGLHVRDDVPLIGFIGRLDPQKGVDIIADAMHWIAGQDVQLVMLGTGRPDLEDMLRQFEAQHHDKVRGWVGFSVQMAHRITAGADVLVMPSRFEPCGLNQLYAMAYGTVPVVHAVGGLRDTVAPFNPFNETGLGWTFDRAEPNKLIEALGHCLNTYRNYKGSWRGLQERGMSQDLSWDHAAQLYEDVLVKAKYQW